jgi:hypothetical protein
MKYRKAIPTVLLPLAPLAALLMLTAALWLAVVPASAQPAMTQDDNNYVTALSEDGIYPSTTASDMASVGRLIAIDVERGYTPQYEATELYQGGLVTMEQARWMVAQAVAVFSSPESHAFDRVPEYFYAAIVSREMNSIK